MLSTRDITRSTASTRSKQNEASATRESLKNTKKDNKNKTQTVMGSTTTEFRPKIPAKVEIEVKAPKTYTKPLEKYVFDNILKAYNVPGLQLVFAHKGEIVFDYSYGHSNFEKKIPASNDKFHRIASVSKAVTRAAIDALVKKGKIDMDKKVFVKYLTQYNTSKNQKLNHITVQHLYDHSVGLWGTVGAGEDPMFYWAHHISREELIQKTIDGPRWKLTEAPGQTWNYSNFGYVLLGRVIEHVTGMNYIDFVRQEFNVDARLAGKTYDELLDNENTYYSADPKSAYGIALARMDAAAGIIIQPRELVKLTNQVDDFISQRGSIAGAESHLIKYNEWTMVAFCNRRKAYLTPLPLPDLFHQLRYQFQYGEQASG